jgi:hypothetical protein
MIKIPIADDPDPALIPNAGYNFYDPLNPQSETISHLIFYSVSSLCDSY